MYIYIFVYLLIHIYSYISICRLIYIYIFIYSYILCSLYVYIYIYIYFLKKCVSQVGQLEDGGQLDMVFGDQTSHRFGHVHLFFHFDDSVADGRKIAHFSLLLAESKDKPFLVLPESVLWLSLSLTQYMHIYIRAISISISLYIYLFFFSKIHSNIFLHTYVGNSFSD